MLADKAGGLESVWKWDTSTARLSRCVRHMIKTMRSVITGVGGQIIEDLIFALAKAPSESHYSYLLGKLRFHLCYVCYFYACFY